MSERSYLCANGRHADQHERRGSRRLVVVRNVTGTDSAIRQRITNLSAGGIVSSVMRVPKYVVVRMTHDR